MIVFAVRESMAWAKVAPIRLQTERLSSSPIRTCDRRIDRVRSCEDSLASRNGMLNDYYSMRQK